jgi:hypothetical protein
MRARNTAAGKGITARSRAPATVGELPTTRRLLRDARQLSFVDAGLSLFSASPLVAGSNPPREKAVSHWHYCSFY